MHCQVMVRDESGRTFTYLDADGFEIIGNETHYCKNPPEYICTSKFKFCREHKRSHGTTGKDGSIHTFTKLKKVKP